MLIIAVFSLTAGAFYSHAVISCPAPMVTVAAPYAANYGCWDGNNFWIGGMNKLYKIAGDGTLLNTYSLPDHGYGSILQMAWDGTYLWIGNYDVYGTLNKFNPKTGKIVKSYKFNPSGLGSGGIQGVVWDGTHLWCGLPENGGIILSFNPSTGKINMTITAQTNVNGLTLAGSGGQEYILAACSKFWSKINAATGKYTTYTTPNTYTAYRIVSDNTYVYVSDYTYGHGETSNRIFKYDLLTGALVDTWTSGAGLNTIMHDGNYIWTAGDDLNVNIHDKNTGNILCTLKGAGQSDLVFDGHSVWSVLSGSDGNGFKGKVNKISMMNPALTPVWTSSKTPTPIPQ